MKLTLSAAETQDVTASLKKYFASELEQNLSDLQATLLLDFISHEIAPFAYNQGVRDAEGFFRSKLEDLPATCFEPTSTYWTRRRK